MQLVGGEELRFSRVRLVLETLPGDRDILFLSLGRVRLRHVLRFEGGQRRV
jgi:hypothetical protein